jgi:hypothetical protein
VKLDEETGQQITGKQVAARVRSDIISSFSIVDYALFLPVFAVGAVWGGVRTSVFLASSSGMKLRNLVKEKAARQFLYRGIWRTGTAATLLCSLNLFCDVFEEKIYKAVFIL